MVLNIPPGKEDHVEFGSCPKKCTNLFSHDIFITQGAVHMHYTGDYFQMTFDLSICVRQCV